MSKLLADYEELNLTQYADIDVNRLILNHADNGELKTAMAQSGEAQTNPMGVLYHWIKGENYDVGSFSACLASRNAVAKRVKELKSKKTSTQKDIETVSAGKKTVTTLFKKPGDVGGMAAKVEKYDAETEVQIKLLDVMTIYLGGPLLDQFKKEKLALYRRVLQQYYVTEVSNCHQSASFWGRMLQEESVKNCGADTF